MDLHSIVPTRRAGRAVIVATSLAMGATLLVAVGPAVADPVAPGGVSAWGYNYP